MCQVRVLPYKRIFLIWMNLCASVIATEDAFLFELLNDTQNTDTIASGSSYVRSYKTIFTAGGDGHLIPFNGVSFLHDDSLRMLLDRGDIDFHVKRTVTNSTVHRQLNRVSIQRIQLHARFTVHLTMDLLGGAFANVVAFCGFWCAIDGQIQPEYTIRVIHRLITIFVLLGLTDRMLERIVDMIARAI